MYPCTPEVSTNSKKSLEMKRLLLSFFVLSFSSVFFKKASAQGSCNIGSLSIQNVNVVGDVNGACRATFDATFTIQLNAANRYIFVQTYIESATQGGNPVSNPPNENPDYFQCSSGTPRTTPPTGAQLDDPILNLVIDNSNGTPQFVDYVLDPTGADPIGVIGASEISVDTLPGNILRYTLTSLQIDMPFACNTGTEYTYSSTVFTTSTADITANVNCLNCNIVTPVPSVAVTGQKFCDVVTITLDNFSGENRTIEFSLYADTDEDQVFLSPGDALINNYSEVVNTGTEEVLTITVSNAFRLRDIFIVETINGAQRVTFVPSAECSTLPVSFKSFNAKRVNNQVTLTWETAMESNNRGFSVQRNTGGGWVEVSFVESKANGGNSNAIISYDFTETNTQKSVTQYRLMQVDIDGKSKVSEIRSVRGLSQVSKNMIYPNPSNDGSVSIIFDDERGNRDVLISDMGGRIIKQYRNVSATTLRVDQLNPGMYSVRVINQSTGTQSNEKLVINR
jgi:hypothetical protein